MDLHYTPCRRVPGAWRLAKGNGFRVFDTNGMDSTARFAGDLLAAMTDMFGITAAPAVPGQSGQASQASVSNAVRVRRHSVIRV